MSKVIDSLITLAVKRKEVDIFAQLIPGWQEINRFPSPLTPGERALAEYFERNLAAEW